MLRIDADAAQTLRAHERRIRFAARVARRTSRMPCLRASTCIVADCCCTLLSFCFTLASDRIIDSSVVVCSCRAASASASAASTASSSASISVVVARISRWRTLLASSSLSLRAASRAIASSSISFVSRSALWIADSFSRAEACAACASAAAAASASRCDRARSVAWTREAAASSAATRRAASCSAATSSLLIAASSSNSLSLASIATSCLVSSTAADQWWKACSS